MGEGNSTAKGFLILSIAGIISKIISVLYAPLLTAIIGTGGYGIYSNTYTVFLFFYAVTSTGVQPAVSKIVTEIVSLEDGKGSTIAFKHLRNLLGVIGTLGALLLMLLAFPIANLIRMPSAGYAIAALGPCILFTCILSAYRGYFQGRGMMKEIAISQVVEQVINVTISLACAYLLVQISIPYGVAGGTVGTGLGALTAVLIMMYYYKKIGFEDDDLNCEGVKKPRITKRKVIKKFIFHGLPTTFTAAVQNFGLILDTSNVNGRLLSAGFSKSELEVLVGYSGQYNQFVGVPMVLITSLAQSVLPGVSKGLALKDRKSIRKTINYGIRMTFLITIPAAVGLMMIREEMYILLFGQESGGSFLMLWGAGVVIFMGLTQLQGTILQGLNKQGVLLKTFVVGLSLKLIINYILVGNRDINILGAVFANYALYIVPSFLNARAINKSANMKIRYIRFVIKPVIASAVMAVSIYAIQEAFQLIIRFTGDSRMINLPIILVAVGVGGFIYFYVMVVMAGIRKRDLDEFSSKIYRYLPRFIRKQMEP
ncbi:MAG: putative polysaccharide biosynthesis protein [Clostridium sp.]